MGARSKWMRLPYNGNGLFHAVVVLFLAVNGGEPSKFSTVWNYDGVVTARKGDELSVTCTVHGVHSVFDVVRITLVQNSKEHVISDNQAKKSPFSQLSRYNVTRVSRDSTATTTLHYNGIQPEDGGILKCEVLGDEKSVHSLNVTVLVPVGELYLVAISTDGSETRADDEAVTLEEDHGLGVGCTATIDGSAFGSEIRVSIDDKDETSLFESITNTTVVQLETGLSLFKSQTRAVLVTNRPNPDFNGKDIECSVAPPGGDMITSSGILSVKFAPIIECQNPVTKAIVGDRVTVRCNVKANPSSQIEWEFADESAEQLLDHENVLFNKTDIGRDVSHVEMTITQIKDSQFRKYRLKAVNEVRATNATVELVQMMTVADSHSLNQNPDTEVNHQHPEENELKQKPVYRDPGNNANPSWFSGVFHQAAQAIVVILSLYLL